MEPKFDFNHFMNRKKLKQKDAASLIGVSSGLVGMWASNKAVPSYEKIVKLIDNGATAEELFGKECADKLLQNSVGLPLQLPPEIANDPDFLAGQNQALKDIEAKIEARVLARLKEKGLAPIPPGSDNVHIDLQDPKFQELVEKALLRIEERKKLNEKGIIK